MKKLPQNKRIKNLYLFCNKCKSLVYDGKKCKVTEMDMVKCKHGEDKFVFKGIWHVPGSGQSRRTKTFSASNVDDAIRQLLDYEKQLKEHGYATNKGQEKNKDIVQKSENIKGQTQPKLLTHCMGRFLAFLNNEGVHPEFQHHRSKGHIDEVERFFRYSAQGLKKAGYNLPSLTVDEIDDHLVGDIVSYIRSEKKFSNSTFNKFLSIQTGFINWLRDDQGYALRNPFKKVPRKGVYPDILTITEVEYKKLLSMITPENGVKAYSNGRFPSRNTFRSYLKDGIELGLETGVRREEIVSILFKDIMEDKISNEPLHIVVPDIKVNRTKNNTPEEQKLKFIPITSSLRDLIYRLGYEEHRGTDRYLIGHDKPGERGKVMMDNLSRGFSHYYRLLGTDRSLQFKCLRKTYLTGLDIHTKGATKEYGSTEDWSGHSSDAILAKHYKDPRQLANVARDFSVWSSISGKDARNDELAGIRENNTIENIKSIER